MSDHIIGSDAPLSPQQTSALRRILSSMIPASAEYDVPGADDPAIFSDVLATGRHSLPELAASLDAMTEHAGRDDPGPPGADEDPAVAWYRQHFPAEVRLLMALTAQCYYRDDRVMKSLGMEPRPPFPDGYELPESDWSLLDPVRRRGPIYRPVPTDTDL